MQRAFVLDKNKKPLMPCHPARARELLRKGKARVFKLYPFTIILTERETGAVQNVAFKIDPGSKQTGIVLAADFKRGKRVLWAAVLEHRGQQIKNALESRRAIRRSRRTRHRLRQKQHFGFQTGDMVKAIVPAGKYAGTHIGRVACRATGSFDITTATGKVTVSHKHIKTIHHSDGYSYTKGLGAIPPRT